MRTETKWSIYKNVEPLINDRLDPNKVVQTEKTKNDASDTKIPSITDNQPSKSFFGNDKKSTEIDFLCFFF
jgi:hypothetical protein